MEEVLSSEETVWAGWVLLASQLSFRYLGTRHLAISVLPAFQLLFKYYWGIWVLRASELFFRYYGIWVLGIARNPSIIQVHIIRVIEKQGTVRITNII